MPYPRYLYPLVRPKNGRRPAKEPFPFQELLPLQLQDKVSGKGQKTADVACLQEISLLFACFQKNDFNEALCSNEALKLQNCHKEFRAMKRHQAEQEKLGVVAHNVKKLPTKQLNTFLSRFPQPK